MRVWALLSVILVICLFEDGFYCALAGIGMAVQRCIEYCRILPGTTASKYRHGVGMFNGIICSVLVSAISGNVVLFLKPHLSELRQLEPCGDRR